MLSCFAKLRPLLRIKMDVECQSLQEVSENIAHEVSDIKKRRIAAVTNSNTPVTLKFAKLTENATTPTRGSELAAGSDLYR